MNFVDAHLDLAYNVSLGRDVRKPAREQPVVDSETASVGLPDLRAGNVRLICATIFCEPQTAERTGYRNSHEAHAAATKQLDWYHGTSELAIVREKKDLRGLEAHATNAIILLEGADPIRNHDDVRFFFDAGVRIVGLAWQRTRYAGGTNNPGPLTDEGKSLVPILDSVGMIHDISHLAEHSFWQLLDATAGPIMASHSNCRAIVGGASNRHLTDDMIRAIIERGGVIGINFFDKFLIPHHDYGSRRANLNDVVAHIKHICDLTANCDHVGIGTDMDGGLGREKIPVEIATSADLPRVADALSAAHFSDDDVKKISGVNWMNFFGRSLPSNCGPQ